MAVTYMAINIFDFILGPILYNLLQYWNPGQAVGMWQPLTLQGGGLIHIAFGAILGISAFTRGQEKVAQIQAGGTDPTPQAPVMNLPTGNTPQQTWTPNPTPAAAPATAPVVDTTSPPPAFGEPPADAAPARVTPKRKIT